MSPIWSAQGAAVTELAAPTDLQCELAAAPMGVDVANPRFSWKSLSPRHGYLQSAYRILVASDETLLLDGRADLWDSGRVMGDTSLLIQYGGKPLASSQQVFWSVQIWDEQRQASPFSAPTSFTMGLLKPEDWRASWITSPGAMETVQVRKEFVTRPALKRAVVHICGLGQYEMSINGTRISDDLFTPGWTNYDRTTLYDSHDVTKHVREGANAVGITLANSMHHVERRNRFAKFTNSFGPQRVIAHLRLEYVDGTVAFVGTDEAWRVHPGPETTASIYGGEDYDARSVEQGWDRAGFDDRHWQPAVRVIRVNDTLRGQPLSVEPVRVIESRIPVQSRAFPDGSVVYDFGQNASFVPRLTVSGPTGSTVRLMPAEVLHPDGTINRDTMGKVHRGYSWWQYTKSSEAPETWTPRFFYIGSRYVRAEFIPATAGGEPPTIAALDMLIVHATAAQSGTFACSNPRLNRIRELVRWAQRSNMVSILTDCPHREKLGWLEQYHTNGPAIRYEFDMDRMFTKAMRDMADSQTPDGLIPNIAPEYTEFKGTFRAAAEWGAAFIHVPWQQYQFSGDARLLQEHYSGMKRYFAYLESRAVGDILAEGLGDWMDIGPKAPGKPQHTPVELTATAFYAENAKLLAATAELLGHPEEARAFTEKAVRIRAAFNAKFFNPVDRVYATGSQCSNALPLVLDLVEPQHRESVLAALIQDLEARHFAITAGDIGYRYLLQALAEGGRSDLVYRMINQDDTPGYGYQLKMGATALTEAWDANHGDSQNHFMLGHVTEWFYKDLAGIDTDPEGPGFKKIIVRPAIVGDLSWVEASYDSAHGKIEVRWDRAADGVITLRATIPANTTATIFAPGANALATRADGEPDADPRIHRMRTEGDRTVFAVPAGTYSFRSVP